MAEAKPPAWLPPGWVVHDEVQKNGRKVRYYTHLNARKKFFSRKAITSYVKREKILLNRAQGLKKHINRSSKDNQNQVPDWLPEGWKVEVRARKSGPKAGEKYKCYINSETGVKFYSKTALIGFLKKMKTFHEEPQASSRCKNMCSGDKHLPFVAASNNYPDWLPQGWIMEVKCRQGGSRAGQEYKCFIEPVKGLKFYSHPAVSRYLKSVGDSCSTSNQMERDTDRRTFYNRMKGCKFLSKIDESKDVVMHSSSKSKRRKCREKVVVEKVEAVGLSPGWTKEIKTRKGRKDPLPHATKRQKSTHNANRESLCQDRLPKVEGLQRTPSSEFSRVSNDADCLPKVEGLQRTPSSEFSSVSNDAETRTDKNFDEYVSASTPAADILEEKRMQENQRTRKSAVDKNKNRKELSTPSRFSKRLAGLEPELLTDLDSCEQDLAEEARPSKNEVAAVPGTGDKSSQQPEVEPREAQLDDNSVCKGLVEETSNKSKEWKNDQSVLEHIPEERERENKDDNSPASNKSTELHNDQAALGEQPEGLKGKNKDDKNTTSNKSKELHNDQAVLGEQPEELKRENKDNNNTEALPPFSFLGAWSDPCLEFAYKTLTGAIPLEDDLAIQDYFHKQQGTSHMQSNGGMVLSDIAFQSGLGEKPTAEPEVVEQDHAVLPAGDVSLGNCSAAAAPCQPSLNGNKACL